MDEPTRKQYGTQICYVRDEKPLLPSEENNKGFKEIDKNCEVPFTNDTIFT